MGGGASRSVCTTALNQICAASFLQVTVDCQQFSDFAQDIQVKCIPEDMGLGIDYYEENPSCIQCWQDIVDQQKSKYDIIKEKWERGGKIHIPMTYNTEFEGYYAQMMPCLLRCKACVFTDWSQTNNYKWDTSCSLDLSSVQNMQNTMQGNITQALTDNQDITSTLAHVFGASDKQEVVQNVMNRLKHRITLGFMESISSSIKNTQSIHVIANGSVVAKGLTQSSAVVGVSKLVAEHNITSNVLSDSQWSLFATVYNQQNSVDELGNVLADTFVGMADLLNSILGRVLVGTVVGVGVIVLIVAIVAIVKAIKHKRQMHQQQ